MASLYEIIEKAKSRKQQQENRQKEKEKRLESIRKKAANRLTIKTEDDVNFINDWFNGVEAVGNNVSKYYSAEGYKAPNNSFDADIQNYLKNAGAVKSFISANKDSFDNYEKLMQAHDSTVKYLTDLKTGVKSNNEFFAEFKDADDFDFWNARNTPEKRLQLYEDNSKKIADLEAEKEAMGFVFPWLDADWKRKTEIDDEIERLQTENANYERGNYNENGRFYGVKKADEQYAVKLRDDFAITSAYRDYEIPNIEEYIAAQTPGYLNQNAWYWENGVLYNDKGEPQETDEFGNWIDPRNKDWVVEDKLGLFLSATEDQRYKAAAGDWGQNNVQSIFLSGIERDWKYLKPEEIEMYYAYLYESQERAYQFLDAMELELNRRRTEDQIGKWEQEYGEANLLGKAVMNLETIPAKFASTIGGTVNNIVNTAQGKDINPYSTAHTGMHYTQTVRNETAEELDNSKLAFTIPVIDFSLGDIYQAGMSRLDSALATKVFGGGGTVFLGMGAAQEEAYRLYQQGASDEQITIGALAAGAAEAFWEYVSFGKLKEIEGKDIDTIFKWVMSKLIQGANEMGEEAATEVSNIITNALVMGSQSDLAELYKENKESAFWTFTDLLQQTAGAAFGGFIGGFGAGTAPSTRAYIQNTAHQKNVGRTITAADGGVDSLKTIGKNVAGNLSGRQQRAIMRQIGNVSGETATGKGIGKIGAAIKNYNNAAKVGRLYSTVVSANKIANAELNKADVVKSLQRKGFDESAANDIASAIVAQYNGQELTKAQQRILKTVEENPNVQKVVSDIIRNESSTVGQRQQVIRDFQQDVRDGVVASASGLSVGEYRDIVKAAQLPQETAAETPTTESGYEVSVDGKTIDKVNGQVINIVGVDSVKDGKMVLKTDTGTIDSSDVSYATEAEAFIYKTVAKLGASPDSSWAMINGFKEADGVSAQDYAHDISLAYKYGKLGFKNGLSQLDLASDQMEMAYKKGREDAAASVKPTKQASTKSTLSEKNAGKKIIFEGFTYNEKHATDTQKASMAAIDTINKISSLEVHVYKSVKKNGKLYAVVNGKERLAPNGYFTEGNKIYIDINAGNAGEGAMLFTMSHEIGHYIARWNAKDFKAISDFLFEHYSGDVPFYDLIEQQKQKLKAGYERDGKAIPSDAALEKAAQEELVCDMLSRMLADKNAYDKLMELKKKDLKLHQKLGQAIKKALAKLAEIIGVYDYLNPDFQYAASKEAFGEEAFRQLQDLYLRAFVQADANYQAAEAQKNTTVDGGEKFSFRDSKTGMANDLLLPYDEELASIIENNGGIIVNSFDKLQEVVNIAFDEPTKKATVYFGILDSTLLEQIEKNVPNIPTALGGKVFKVGRTYSIAASLDSIRHLTEDKGLTREDVLDYLDRMADTIVENDTVYFDYYTDSRNNKIKGLLFKKTYNDGTMVSFEIISSKKMSMNMQTMYMDSASYEKKKSAKTPLVQNTPAHTPKARVSQTSNIKVAQVADKVKYESAEALDVEVDEKTESVAPSVVMSERTWTESDYVQEREKAAKEIAKAIGVSEKKAEAYIDSVNSIAKMIADDRVRLDYFSSPGRSSFVGNVEYGGSFDFSTLCKKRRLLTGTFTAIQNALPNTALTADEILKIRNRMKEKGLEVSCGLCYVEGSRGNMGQFAKEFLKLYKQYYPDAWQPNMADVNTPDGIEWVRINHPECYEQYEYFWNHYGTLKPGDKNLFASQQKPKLYQLHTEYKGEILDKFKSDDTDNVEDKNLNGGIRLQSFSDFEIVHLIDTMQIIMDMSRVGLAGQAYTKVPDFARALGDTGLKINLSLIAKGVDENGKLIFDDVEGMPIDTAVALREHYSKNVGTILVAFNDSQLLAAMADDRVDFIIPFHRSQWKKSQYEAMGLPAKTKDYTYMQNEKYIKPQFHEYRGRLVKDKATNYMPNEYWDFSKSGKENAEAYLEMCARNNKRPKFYKLLQNNGDGSYSLKADGSTDGYWKLLIDFKMYDNNGVGSPQMPVKPDFNMDEATKMLNEYSGGHSNFPVAQGIVDDFVREYKDSHKGAMFSERDSGNVIPLSERFNPENEDIRYSDRVYDDAVEKFGTTTDFAEAGFILPNGKMLKFTDDKHRGERQYDHRAIGMVYGVDVDLGVHHGFNEESGKFLDEFVENGGIRFDAGDPSLNMDIGLQLSSTIPLTKAQEQIIRDLVEWKVAREVQFESQMTEDDFLYRGPLAIRIDFGGDSSYAVGAASTKDLSAWGKKSLEYEGGNINADRIIADIRHYYRTGETREPSRVAQFRFQERSEDSVSNRSLLANAFEGVAQNEIERNKIQEYKGKISLINAEEQKLHELNEQIKKLSFAKGPRDTKKIAELREEANKTANRINIYDKQLLRLEASKPLQAVLDREKKASYKRAEQKGKETLAAYKAAVMEEHKQAADEWRESRKQAVAKVRETSAKRDAREKLQKVVLDTVKWITYPAKTDVKCPDILKKPYHDFLKGIDMSSNRLGKGGDPTKNDLRMANAMDSLATALDKIMTAQDPSTDVDKVLDTGYLDLPEKFVKQLRDMAENIKGMMVDGDYVVNNMTAAEVRQLSQMIRTLNHAIKTMSKLYANLRFSNIEALGYDTMEFLGALGEIEKTGGLKDFVQWDNALPYYAFKRFGKGGESVFEALMDSQDKLAFLAQEIFDFQEKTWTGKEAKAWSEDTHTITLPNGNDLTLTTADAMSIYCLSRREHAVPHLLGGGIRVMGIQKGSKKAKDSRSLLTIEDIDAIVSSLTDRQKQVAEAMQEFMSTVCSEWGNEISMKRFLTKEFNEKFYFPIESNDENLATKDPAAQQSDLFRLLNISATKPLTEGANNEVIIRNVFDVFTGHASDMARLNAYGMGLLDYMKWLNYREKSANEDGQINVVGVRKSMEKAYGKAANSYLLNLVKDVNGRPSDGGDPSILMKWMRTAKTASVGSSLRVATLQITSYPRASLVLSPKSLALGLTKKPNIKKAMKYCGIALWKSFGFYDTNISRSIEEQMKGVTDVRQKLIELSLKGAEIGDAVTWGALWNACEYEVAATKKFKVGTEEFNQAVGKKLREVVYSTQVVDSTLTRSQIMRSKRGMAQEAAAFMSEPTLSANILMDAGFQFNAEKRRTGSAKVAWRNTGAYVGKAIAVYAIGQLSAALLEGLWDAWRDEDDEEFWKKYIDAFAENLVMDLAPFNKIPIVSDVFEAALAMFGVGFYSSDKMSTTWLTQAVSAADAWKEVIGGESSMTVYNAIYKTMRTLSSFFGVSVSGVMREGVALWNNTAGAYDSTLKIRTWDLSKTALAGEALDAIIDGNHRQAESIKAQFQDEDSYHDAMRTAIKERFAAGQIDSDTALQYLVDYAGIDEDDAYWKVQEWMYESETGDDYAKYGEFFTAVETGKNLKAVIKQYTDNGVTTEALATQITNHFKPIYMEMSTSEREKLKGYLLNAYGLCGVERADAEEKIAKWQFEGDHPELVDRITYTQYKRWEADGKPNGVSIDLFVEVSEFRDDGTSNSAKSQEEVAAYINSLPISTTQKDALWCCFWKASTLKNAPWH